MSWAVCQLDRDASSIRLARDAGEASWHSPPAPEGQAPGDAARATLAQSAQWLAEQRLPGSRIDVAVVSTDDASCTWLAAPSTDRAVVLAAVRQRDQEWGAAAASVQPLVDPESAAPEKKRARMQILPDWWPGRNKKTDETKGAPRRSGDRMAVLRFFDGAERLWLDELDSRGVRVGVVTSLWHVVARAWAAPGQQLSASVVIDPAGRLVWAWSTGPRLAAAGVVGLSPDAPAPAATDAEAGAQQGPIQAGASRIALDWMTWSAQIGRRPEHIRIVGPGAREMAERLSAVWPATPTDAQETDDPMGKTLQRIGQELSKGMGPDPENPREAVLELSSRPGRAHRRLYWSSAAAILGLAAAIGVGAWRTFEWAGELQAAAAAERAGLREAVTTVSPAAADNPFPDNVLAEELRALDVRMPRIPEPDPPPPILDELVRVTQALQEFADRGAELDRVAVGRNSAISIRTKDIATAEAIRAAIRGDGRLLEWSQTPPVGNAPNVSLRLTGDRWRPAPPRPAGGAS